MRNDLLLEFGMLTISLQWGVCATMEENPFR